MRYAEAPAAILLNWSVTEARAVIISRGASLSSQGLRRSEALQIQNEYRVKAS